ncbi:MAG TPA: hypothetical protein VGP93_02115 [Polyangiaceae bacterium]|jgi:hypothetical protein|nr:hypothetical protein [Polyangiaceae bacterium]
MKVSVDGDANELDSFVACVTAIAGAWGDPSGYDRTAGLSGIAFSPAWNRTDAAHFAIDGGADRRISFLGAALGFSVETLYLAQPGETSLRGRSEAGRAFDAHSEFVAAVTEQVERGSAVILRTWPVWSVMTHASPRAEDWGLATLPGFEELTRALGGPERARLAYALKPRKASLSPREALAQAIRFGAFVARDQQSLPSDSCLAGSEGVAFGGLCYEACTERLREQAFCRSCPDDPATCLHRVLRLLHRSQRSGEVFVAMATSALRGEPSEPFMCRARACYSELCALTQPYLRLDAWKALWRARSFRMQLAEDFAEMCRLQAAAAHELMHVL